MFFSSDITAASQYIFSSVLDPDPGGQKKCSTKIEKSEEI
jgi:hypothetical protein